MAHKDEEGLALEYLEDLTFYDENFVYKDCDYPYEDILSIKYTATAIKKSVNFVPTGTSYETYLCLHLADGFKLTIDQESSFLGIKEKEKAEAIMRASGIFHEITFTNRMERYEKQLNEKGYISWGNYQFGKNGDFFKKNELLFNLKDDGVIKALDVFTFETGKKPQNFKQSFAKFWKGNEVIDISTDKDCFLYFMKNYLGFTWKNEPVKDKKKPRQHEFFEAMLVLGAKVCNADGRVDTEEIQTFKTYFGIDESSFPGSAEIFAKATASAGGVEASAQKVYSIFEGQQELLEHIIIGLLQIAAADGVITDDEVRVIEKVCAAFKFSKTETERLFLIFDHIRKEKKSSSRTHYSSSTRTEHLKILGLSANASHDEVKVAYKELVRKHHPDLLMSQGVPLKRIKDSEEILKAVNAAYNWLSNEANELRKGAA
ncbi:MAG: TerB family tellurite resistance protein [Rhodospirillales bacterium]|nr:TerB family tellurite resistance protein [Rhodospirillales bacterium]